ncbi:hypothetical protein GOODEAATRI_030021 [Goodea atripinnis]|uniref:Poly(A) RNA polymerase mitochondrial-like central palm domain-containing protein n=1 Tax=Goodea atripinnis TaxID=208336 RepID=A0ABV0Q273_9TELE
MLRFYSLEFIMADNVIGVRTNAVLSREMKDWPKKRIAIEGARLQLFGSSKNGFGFRQSDLDICMVLEGKETMDVSYLSVSQIRCC